MKPAPFAYHRPETAAEAVALLGALGDEAKVLAGGQSLIPILALRLAVFEHLVDVARIESLRGIEPRSGELWVGAGTIDAAVEASPVVLETAPLLARATAYVGHFQIRNRGTVGGSLAHADPAAEYPAVAVALDATMHMLGVAGPRTVAAADFFTGVWSTSMAPDELLTGVSFPAWSGRCGFGVEEFARRHGDFAIAGAVVAVELDEDDRVVRCGMGMIGMGPTPVRGTPAEAAVLGHDAGAIEPDAVGRLAVSACDAIPSDLHGSAAYRARVGGVMAARAWRSAVSEAQRG